MLNFAQEIVFDFILADRRGAASSQKIIEKYFGVKCTTQTRLGFTLYKEDVLCLSKKIVKIAKYFWFTQNLNIVLLQSYLTLSILTLRLKI